jgi:hypothetical protein
MGRGYCSKWQYGLFWVDEREREREREGTRDKRGGKEEERERVQAVYFVFSLGCNFYVGRGLCSLLYLQHWRASRHIVGTE